MVTQDNYEAAFEAVTAGSDMDMESHRLYSELVKAGKRWKNKS